jgi:hypothetical protein
MKREKMKTGPVQKSGTAQKPWANSRTPVHPNFDRHSSVGAKRELKERRK